MKSLEGYNPVYSINGEVNPDKWGYTPCKGETLEKIWLNEKMTGFRLPTYNEWEHAALCGEHYIFEKAECAEDFIW